MSVLQEIDKSALPDRTLTSDLDSLRLHQAIVWVASVAAHIIIMWKMLTPGSADLRSVSVSVMSNKAQFSVNILV